MPLFVTSVVGSSAYQAPVLSLPIAELSSKPKPILTHSVERRRTCQPSTSLVNQSLPSFYYAGKDAIHLASRCLDRAGRHRAGS